MISGAALGMLHAGGDDLVVEYQNVMRIFDVLQLGTST